MATPLAGTEITPMDLRASLGELLDHVRLRQDTFIVTRRGKPIAALVSVERLELMQEVAAKYSRLMSRIQAEHVAKTRQPSDEIDAAAVEAVKRVRAGRRRG